MKTYGNSTATSMNVSVSVKCYSLLIKHSLVRTKFKIRVQCEVPSWEESGCDSSCIRLPIWTPGRWGWILPFRAGRGVCAGVAGFGRKRGRGGGAGAPVGRGAADGVVQGASGLPPAAPRPRRQAVLCRVAAARGPHVMALVRGDIAPADPMSNVS